MFDLRRAASRTILAAALVGFISSATVFADSPSVTAVLSNSEAAVGETVELQIRVTGSGAKLPNESQWMVLRFIKPGLPNVTR